MQLLIAVELSPIRLEGLTLDFPGSISILKVVFGTTGTDTMMQSLVDTSKVILLD